MAAGKLLRIYLRDQLALAVAFEKVARRCRMSNLDGELGELLSEIDEEMQRDRDALETLMSQAGITKNRFKMGAMALAEKLGRLKLNGRLLRYSDLSRLYELEALAIGLEMKEHLWGTLAGRGVVGEGHATARASALGALRTRLEPHRSAAATRALAR